MASPERKVVYLHRGIVPPDYAPPRFVRPLNPEEIAQAMGDAGMLEALAERAPLWPTRHIEPYRPSRFERFCNWLGDTFDESPRGFAFFAGLLFPLCIAAFCVGYFGLRELLAGFGL